MLLLTWYFVQCVRFDPGQARSLLAAVGQLDDPDTDIPGRIAAIRALQAMDPWRQGWGLRAVLASRHLPDQSSGSTRGAERSRALRREVDGHVAAIGEWLPKDVSDLLTAAWRACAEVMSPDAAAIALDAADHCARALQRASAARPSDEPYADLKDFLAETSLLEILRSEAVYSQALRAALQNVTTIQDDADGIAGLIKRALEGRHGRLAFCAAVAIRQLAGSGLAPTDLVEHLWRRGAPPFEPDLLECFATTVPGGANAVIEEADRGAMMESLVRLEPQDSTAADAAIHRIGLESAGPVWQALPQLYWRATLWVEALRREPLVAAMALGRLFEMPPLRPAEVGVGFTPWLRLRSEDDAERQTLFTFHARRHTRYSGTDDVPRMMGLILAAWVAVRCLQVRGLPETARRAHARLVVHGDEVLAAYSWLSHHPHSQPKREDVDLPVGALIPLAQWAATVIEYAGTGRLVSVSPGDFLVLTDAEAGASREEWVFRHNVLPYTVLRWIRDGYEHAYFRTLAGRWLDVLQQALSLADEASGQNHWHRRQAALLRRFLLPDSPLASRNLSWREELRRWNNGGLALHGEALFIDMSAPAEELAEEPNRFDKVPATWLLGRALVRVAALGRLPAGAVPDEARWRHEWKEMLWSLMRPDEISRYVRLQLLVLLDDPALATDADAQELIVGVLAEYGCPYDLQRLALRLFPNDSGTWREASPERHQARRMAIQALVVRRRQPPPVGAWNPDAERREAACAEVITRTLERVAFAGRRTDDPTLRELAVLLARALEEASNGSPAWIAATARVVQRDGKAFVRLDDPLDAPPDAIAVDVNAGVASLVRMGSRPVVPDAPILVSLTHLALDEVHVRHGNRLLRWPVDPDDLDRWDPDLSRAFRPPDDVEYGPFFARRSRRDSERWVPAPVSLLELLQLAPLHGDCDRLVLTLVGREVEGGWLVAARPGLHAMIEPSRLAAGDAARLRSLLPRDPNGLVLSLDVADVGGELKLRLAAAPAHDPVLDRRYPDLTVPVDDRNRRWRTAIPFGDGEAGSWRLARAEGSGWIIEIAADRQVAGFPLRIVVDWVGSWPPGADEVLAQVNPYAKGLRLGRVQGRYVRQHALDVPENVRHTWLSGWWVSGHDAVALRRVVGSIGPRGFVTAATEEGALVFVEAESLSMRWVDQRDPYALIREARAAWRYRRQFPHPTLRVELDDSAAPKNTAAVWRGVIATVVPGRGPARVTIWWLADDGVVVRNGVLTGSRDPYLAPGLRIEARGRPGSWTVFLQRSLDLCCALWELVSNEAESSGGEILGQMSFPDGKYWVAEARPGQMVRSPRVPTDLSLPTNRLVARAATGLDTVDVAPDGPAWVAPDGASVRRTKLRSPDGDQILCGLAWSDVLPGRVTVDNIVLTATRLQFERGKLFHLLSRRFLLRPDEVDDASRRDPGEESAEQEIDNWSKLDEALGGSGHEPTVFNAKADRGEIPAWFELYPSAEVQVPDGAGGWTRRVALVPGEGPWWPDGRYDSSAARIVLVQEGERVLASLRGVPAESVEGFGARVRGDSALEQDVPLRQRPLTYAGEMFDGDGRLEGFRFEFGLGHTVEVPLGRLWMPEGPYDGGNALFPGDTVHVVRFAEKDKSPDEGPALVLVLVKISIHHTTQLFQQRQHFNLVHVLHVELDRGRLVVRQVIGVDPDAVGDSIELERTRALVHADDESKIIEALASSNGKKVRQPRATVFGRLDTAEFERSRGARVVFRRVLLTFDAVPTGTSLRPEETLLLRAGRITRAKNETLLVLDPPPDLLVTEGEVRRLTLTRRRFSVCQDVLPAYHRSGGEVALKDRWFLVQAHRERTRPFVLTLVEGRRHRTTRALRRSLEGTRGPTFARVGLVNPLCVSLELRPGVTVQLVADDVSRRPAELGPGDIVRISAEGEYFAIVRAGPGDQSFLDEAGRPIVLLPMNELIDPRSPPQANVWRSTFWGSGNARIDDDPALPVVRDRRLFTVGGLPNLTLSCVGPQGPPHAQDWVRLMESPHPKVGIALVQPGGLPTARPEPVVAVAMEIHDEPLSVDLIDVSSGRRTVRDAEWEGLTWADEPVEDIVERVRSRPWRYHDVVTGHWQDGGIREEPVEPCTGLTGPLFLHPEEHLRYPASDLRRWGFPTAELASVFERDEDAEVTVVASRDGFMWIELAPGRVVELPLERLFLRVGDRHRPLADLASATFGPGDRLRLERVTDLQAGLDRFFLAGVIGGARSALGDVSFLPIVRSETRPGALRLGAGAYALTMPVRAPPPRGRMVRLDISNRWKVADQELPAAGDVVLLVVGSDDRPTVAGTNGIWIRAADEVAWEGDPLRDWLIEARQSKLHLRFNALAELIRAVGGALPVTVEAVAVPPRVLISRRLQVGAAEVPVGSRVRAVVAGAVGDRLCLLRVGGGLLPMDARDVVAGIEASHAREVLAALIAARSVVWLTRTADGFTAALDADAGREIQVEVEAVVDGPQEQGLICRARRTARLHWLPAAESGWTDAPVSAIGLALDAARAGGLEVAAVELPSGEGRISLCRTVGARRERRMVRLGAEIMVQPLLQLKDGIWLSITRSGGVLVTSTLGEPLGPEEKLRVQEIESVDEGRPGFGRPMAVRCVDRGRRLRALDLPYDLLAKCLPGDAQLDGLWEAWRGRRLDGAMARAVCAWAAEAVDRPEMDALRALRALTVMLDIAEPGREDAALELAENLAQRARRSGHVEVLTRYWLGRPDVVRSTGGSWGRLNRIRESGYLRPTTTPEAVAAIRRWCRSVHVHLQVGLQPIADALSVAMGDASGMDGVFPRAERCRALASLGVSAELYRRRQPGSWERLSRSVEEAQRAFEDGLPLILLDALQPAD